MELNPYLTFEGTCEKAMRFYANVLGGEVIALMRFSEIPDADWVPEEKRNWIAHMQVRIADRVLMASDNGRSEPVGEHRGFDLQLAFDDMDAARRIFDALSSGGKIGMPFDKTFWARGFGSCRDKFGIPWMVNCD